MARHPGVRRHRMGPPRIRPQNPLLVAPVDPVGVGAYDPAPSSRLFANRNRPDNQCPKPGNGIKIVYRIREHKSLGNEAKEMGKDQKAQKDVNNLLNQLALGNENPGIGSKPIGGGISELRGFNEGRVYYRTLRKSKETVYEILGKSNKDNQEKVIALVKRHFLKK